MFFHRCSLWLFLGCKLTPLGTALIAAMAVFLVREFVQVQVLPYLHPTVIVFGSNKAYTPWYIPGYFPYWSHVFFVLPQAVYRSRYCPHCTHIFFFGPLTYDTSRYSPICSDMLNFDLFLFFSSKMLPLVKNILPSHCLVNTKVLF